MHWLQENKKLIGYYTVQEVCTSVTFPNYSDTFDYEIEIKPLYGDTFDIEMYLEAHFPDTIRAKIINESTFHISLQAFKNFDNSFLYISGDGYLIKDSIEINYRSGGSEGVFECTCKGIRKKESVIKLISNEDSKISISPNPVKQEVNISVSEPGNWFIELRQLGDMLVLSKSFYGSKFNIQLPELPSGLYLLMLKNGNKLYIRKLVVI